MSSPEQAETPPAVLRIRGEPDAIVLVLAGPLPHAAIPALCEQLGALLEEGGAGDVVCDVGRLPGSDAVAVDALARMQLTARRLGRRFRLERVRDELRDLLALMGLEEVVCPRADLSLQPEGDPEQREQGGGIEEEGDPADPIA